MATTSPDNIWTPDSPDQYDLTVDLAAMATSVQAAIEKRGNSYRGTSAQRTAFASQARPGDLWSDTNGAQAVWVWTGVWTEIPRNGIDQRAQNSGTGLPSISQPSTPPSGSNLRVLSGFWHGFTTFSVGAERAPTVNYPVPFIGAPVVTVTHIGSGSAQLPLRFGLDISTTGGFRVIYGGTNAATERGFLWQAVGPS